jgi:hypothetical protein
LYFFFVELLLLEDLSALLLIALSWGPQKCWCWRPPSTTGICFAIAAPLQRVKRTVGDLFDCIITGKLLLSASQMVGTSMFGSLITMKTLQTYYQCWLEVVKQKRYQDKWLLDETLLWRNEGSVSDS